MKFGKAIVIRSKVFPVFLLLSLLSACGGGGGSTGTGDVIDPPATPFAVDHLSPASNATGVSSSTTVAITFNKDIDCTSVTDATFTVVDANSAAVTGAASCSGATATFTPAAILVQGVQYTATVAATIKDAGGATLSGAQSWSFTTNSAAKVGVPILGTITGLSAQAVGADSAGNAIMLYRRQQDATHFTIGAMRYTQATGTWPLAGHNELGTDVRASGPIEIAVNKDGYALALWNSYLGSSVYYAYYNPNTSTWSGKTVIFSQAGAVLSLDAKIDDNGNAMATWAIQNGTGGRQVFARYYPRVAGSWNPLHDLTPSGWPNGQDPHFAFDANGNGMAVFGKWRAIGFAPPITYVNKVSSLTYDVATDAWSDEVEIADGTNPDIGIDASGKAVAVWIKKLHWDDPLFPPAHDYYGVGSATRAAGGAWDVTFLGAGWDPKGDASEPRVAVTPGGDAMVMWRFTRGSGFHYNINAAYLPTGATTWIQAGESVEPELGDAYSVWRVVSGESLGADALTPKMALDANGKATLVYCMTDGTRYNVYTRSFTNAARTGQNSGWSETREIDSTNSNAYGGLVTVAGTGATMTVWQQTDSAINEFWYLRE